MKRNHAFVIGATGFIGSRLVHELVSRKYTVSCLVHSKKNIHRLKNLEVERIDGDLNDPESLKKPVSQADVIFHSAGTTKAVHRSDYFTGNQDATRQLIDVMSRHGKSGQKLVYISSQTASSPCANEPGIDEFATDTLPVSAYGQSKRNAEAIVMSISDRFPVVILRPSVVYGPEDLEMEPIFKAARIGIMAQNGMRKFPVSLIFVDDLVRAILMAAESDKTNGKIYFVSDGQVYDWNILNHQIASLVNPRARILPVPLSLIWFICKVNGIIARITGRPFYMNPDKWLEIKQDGWVCDSSRLRNDLGFYRQWSLDKGIKKTVEWYRETGRLPHRS